MNSGFAAINVAWHMGFRRAILVGFDMAKDQGKGHFFGEHPKPLNMASDFDAFMRHFSTIDQSVMEVWNCSRRSAMTCFPRYDLDAALRVI